MIAECIAVMSYKLLLNIGEDLYLEVILKKK